MTIINHDCYPFLEAFGLYDPNSALTWTGKAGHPDAIHYSNSYPNKLVAFRDGYTDADDEWLKPLDDSSNQYFYVWRITQKANYWRYRGFRTFGPKNQFYGDVTSPFWFVFILPWEC